MGWITAVTSKHFAVHYDDTLLNQTLANVNAQVLSPTVLEKQFEYLIYWFGFPRSDFEGKLQNIYLIDMIPHTAGYNKEGNIFLNAYTSTAYPELLIQTFVAEWSEILMSATGKWNPGDSSGEGLSQFCAARLVPEGYGIYNTAANGTVSLTWLNNYSPFYNSAAPDPKWPLKSPVAREDFINKTAPTDKDPFSFSCAHTFLNYLHFHLNFTEQQIIAAGAPTLAEVYQNLTGRNDGHDSFMALINQYYPMQFKNDFYYMRHSKDASLFPVADLQSLTPPGPVTSGQVGHLQVTFNRAPKTILPIDVFSDNTNIGVVSTPYINPFMPTIGMVHNDSNGNVDFKTKSIPISVAMESFHITVRYAGTTLVAAINVAALQVTAITLAKSTLSSNGDHTTGEIILNSPNPGPNPIFFHLHCDATKNIQIGQSFMGVPILGGHTTGQFNVESVKKIAMYPSIHTTIYTTLRGHVISTPVTVKSNIDEGFLSSFPLHTTETFSFITPNLSSSSDRTMVAYPITEYYKSLTRKKSAVQITQVNDFKNGKCNFAKL